MVEVNFLRHKLTIAGVLGTFLCSSTTPLLAATATNASKSTAIDSPSSLQENGGRGSVKVARKRCVLGVCVDIPDTVDRILGNPAEQAVNEALKSQLRQVLKEELPITGTEHRILPQVRSLPGGAFRPKKLDLLKLSSSTVIPAGDYEVTVHMYCTKVYTMDGSGNRYTLAKLEGKMAPALAAFYAKAGKARVPVRDIQTISWSIQTGVPFDKLPSHHQQLVQRLIPEYIPQMRKGFVEQVTQRWNQASRITGGRVPSFEKVLNDLGPLGDVASSVLRARQELLSKRFSYRDLERSFVTERNVNLPGGYAGTPWTKISDYLYLRVIAPNGAMQRAKVQIRVLPMSGRKGVTATGKGGAAQTLVAQANPATVVGVTEILEAILAGTPTGLVIGGTLITAGLLYYLITQVVAIPESRGHQAGTFTVEPGIDGGTGGYEDDSWTVEDENEGVVPPPRDPSVYEDYEPIIPNPPQQPQPSQPRPVPPIFPFPQPNQGQGDDQDKRRDPCHDRFSTTWNFRQVPGFPGLCYGRSRGSAESAAALNYTVKVRTWTGTPMTNIADAVWARGAAARGQDLNGGVGVEFDAFKRSSRELVDIKYWNSGGIYDLNAPIADKGFAERTHRLAVEQAKRQVQAISDLPVAKKVVWIMPNKTLVKQWQEYLNKQQGLYGKVQVMELKP